MNLVSTLCNPNSNPVLVPETLFRLPLIVKRWAGDEVEDIPVYRKIECTCSDFLSGSIVLECVSNSIFVFHHIKKFKVIQFHGICESVTKVQCIWIYN